MDKNLLLRLKEVDMILLSFINPSDIETSLGKEKSKPIVDAFNTIAQNLEKNQNVLDNQQKQIETHQESFDKQQRILADQEVVIHEIKENFEEYKKGDLDRKTEIKKDLLIELAVARPKCSIPASISMITISSRPITI